MSCSQPKVDLLAAHVGAGHEAGTHPLLTILVTGVVFPLGRETDQALQDDLLSPADRLGDGLSLRQRTLDEVLRQLELRGIEQNAMVGGQALRARQREGRVDAGEIGVVKTVADERATPGLPEVVEVVRRIAASGANEKQYTQ